MTKPDILNAIDFAKSQQKSLTEWVINNVGNPYMSKVAADVRHWESEERRLLELYGEEYPSLMEARGMTNKELLLLMRGLRKPSTPLQEEIYNYIKNRISLKPIDNHE